MTFKFLNGIPIEGLPVFYILNLLLLSIYFSGLAGGQAAGHPHPQQEPAAQNRDNLNRLNSGEADIQQSAANMAGHLMSPGQEHARNPQENRYASL